MKKSKVGNLEHGFLKKLNFDIKSIFMSYDITNLTPDVIKYGMLLNSIRNL